MAGVFAVLKPVVKPVKYAFLNRPIQFA